MPGQRRPPHTDPEALALWLQAQAGYLRKTADARDREVSEILVSLPATQRAALVSKLADAKLNPPKTGPAPIVEDNRLIEALVEGGSIAEAGRILGISAETIRSRLRRNPALRAEALRQRRES